MYSMEENLVMLIPSLLMGIPTGVLGLAAYVLSALAINTIARRRGLRKPWLAWIPVVNAWLLGSLSDQYQYVTRREDKSKRKWLLGLSMVQLALWAAVVVLAIVVAATVLFGGYRGTVSLAGVLGPAMGLLSVLLPLAAVIIARFVIRYMALYDVFKSLDPDNCVLYLVLSILFRPTESFFLFFNRDKDRGMPPRKQEPVWTQPEPQCRQEENPFWETQA